MSLLDSLLGMVTGGQGAQGTQAGAAGGNAALLNAVVGMLAGGGGGGGGGSQAGAAAGGMGGAGGMGAAGAILASLGGLGGLMSKFQQAGLGDVMSSWVGSGQNAPITADQLHKTLGPDVISSLAGQSGMSHDDVTSQLSSMLPQLIDRLTPHGQAPAGGLGDIGSILAQLGKK